MAMECPMCKSTRTYSQRKFFGPKIFGCASCGWTIPVEEFHKQGGTLGIRKSLKSNDEDD